MEMTAHLRGIAKGKERIPEVNMRVDGESSRAARLGKVTKSHERLVELIFAVANYNGVVRMLESLKIDVEDKYKKYLERFPL